MSDQGEQTPEREAERLMLAMGSAYGCGCADIARNTSAIKCGDCRQRAALMSALRSAEARGEARWRERAEQAEALLQERDAELADLRQAYEDVKRDFWDTLGARDSQIQKLSDRTRLKP